VLDLIVMLALSAAADLEARDRFSHLPRASALRGLPSLPEAVVQRARWREHTLWLSARWTLLAGFAQERARVEDWIRRSRRHLHGWEVLVAAWEVSGDGCLEEDLRQKLALLGELAREDGPLPELPEVHHP